VVSHRPWRGVVDCVEVAAKFELPLGYSCKQLVYGINGVITLIKPRVLFFMSIAALWLQGAQAAANNASKQDRPEVRSNSVLVMDAGDSSVLFARNADAPHPIASLTKLMTALVVLESRQPLDERIEITREDRDGTRGAASRLSVGAKLTRSDLLHLALMASDNRAAHALSRAYPGGKPEFVRAMTVKARALGMTHARFLDPSGLSPDNVASAADIAKLVMVAAHNETIRDYSTDRHYSVTLAKRQIEFRNTNYLVAKPDWQIDVQKTGYTSEAGECLAMKTTIQGRSLVIVLLDSFGKYTRTADARRIRKWLEARSPQQIARVSNG
jgi:D-alanyl-D-alanine endopeptidase (penicillin-binding protein 7)